jgi:hypothetical protein
LRLGIKIPRVTGAKALFLLWARYAALKRRSFTVVLAVVVLLQVKD